jgi:alpha-tubulin suppressor-like RCC1 family protein
MYETWMSKKEAPMLGLMGMGGGVASLMWHESGVSYEQGYLFGSGTNQKKWYLNLPAGTKRSSPVQIGTDSNWIYTYSGGGTTHQMALNVDKEMRLWGSNQSGCWGNNDDDSGDHYITSGFTQPGPWISATTGYFRTMGVKDDGTAWAWGQNDGGVLGLNQPENIKLSSPTQIGTNTNWQCIKTGGGKTCIAIKTDGTLWAWGENRDGILGQNQQQNYGPSPFPYCSSPVQVGTDTNWGTSDNSIDVFNERAICINGGSVMLALKTNNTLWTWGSRSDGAMGLNIGPNNSHRSSPCQVPGSWARIGGNCTNANGFSYGIKQDNTMWMWGYNFYGILGQNNRTSRSSPTQIPGSWKIDGCLTGGGTAHMGAVKTDGTFWSWGYAYMGGLGLNYGNYPSIYCVSSPARMGNTSDWIWGAGGSEYRGLFLQKS